MGTARVCMYARARVNVGYAGMLWGCLQIRKWSNVFCGRLGDHGLRWAVHAYNARPKFADAGEGAAPVEWRCLEAAAQRAAEAQHSSWAQAAGYGR